MALPIPEFDVLIFGGGVAGLWTLARLRRLGFNCLLLENRALGSGQTIASQGIIHGGVKYALASEPSTAATSIAQMPRIWDECLAGGGEIDLSDAREGVLSENQYLWTTPGLVSRVAGFGASRLIRAESERLAADNRPAEFAKFPAGIDIYRVPERVIDTRSLVAALAGPTNSGGRLARPPSPSPTSVAPTDTGAWSVSYADPRGGPPVSIRSRALVLAAGEGNSALMEASGLGLSPVSQQLRPLHMVMMRPAPFELFGHCIGASSLPRLTITTGRIQRSGELVWYIGGAIAEGAAIDRSASEQIMACRRELRECLDWADAPPARFGTLRINRAEGFARHSPRRLSRPDTPMIAWQGSAIIGWPTKLAFAPAFATRVVGLLEEEGIERSGRVGANGDEPPFELPFGLAPIGVAPHPWEGAQWN